MLSAENFTQIEPAHEKTNKMACVPSKALDQPGLPPSLIGVFTVRSVSSSGPKLSSCGQSLRWVHMSFCWLRRALANFNLFVISVNP